MMAGISVRSNDEKERKKEHASQEKNRAAASATVTQV
jgi:hypothetical protein